jgi:hypothetical protein
MRVLNLGHSGYELISGARSAAGQNSEPGITAQKGWALMACWRLPSKDLRTVALWRAADWVQANWNRGGATGGEGVARIVDS